jgi:hypothetical protein
MKLVYSGNPGGELSIGGWKVVPVKLRLCTHMESGGLTLVFNASEDVRPVLANCIQYD